MNDDISFSALMRDQAIGFDLHIFFNLQVGFDYCREDLLVSQSFIFLFNQNV